MIRAIDADDGPLLQSFVRRLSARSRRFRFFSALVELSAAELERLVKVDRRRQLALVALTGRSECRAIIAEARCVVNCTARSAEFAVAVTDEFQRRGLGTQLVQRLFTYASKMGVRRLFGEILPDNRGMLALARRLGFRIRTNASDESVVIADMFPLMRCIANDLHCP
jgi:acetyltransferase